MQRGSASAPPQILAGIEAKQLYFLQKTMYYYIHAPPDFQTFRRHWKKDPPQKQQAEFSIKNYWQKMIKHSFFAKT